MARPAFHEKINTGIGFGRDLLRFRCERSAYWCDELAVVSAQQGVEGDSAECGTKAI